MKQYHLVEPDKIAQDILQNDKVQVAEIEGIECFILPGVYPSDKFRSSKLLMGQVKSLAAGKRVCDMGCGCGIIGLIALDQGAELVIQADISPISTKNANLNRVFHNINQRKLKIFKSDCFDNVPSQKFDLVIFNIPFHSTPCEFDKPIDYAFHDPDFVTLRKFLEQVSHYSHSNTEIIIAFSNRGDVTTIEKLFETFGFCWKLWKIANQDQKYDSRLYKLKVTTL